MNAQSPYEQIRFINDVIKDRQAKKEQTYFSVKLERMGVQTPLVSKEEGNSFYETIIQYLTKYELSALVIELYHAKSHNVKTPFQTFKIQVKRSQDIMLGNVENKQDLEVLPTESVISPEKHFYTMAEKERANILLEFRIRQLEWELDILRKKNKKKKEYIQELENSLEKSEREKKNSLGNVTLGSVASNAIETFARSNFGIGILKNVFGAKEDVINGLLGADTNSNGNSTETKSTASIIGSETKEEKMELSQNDKIRLEIIKSINDFLLNADDGVLRLYYELFMFIGSDLNLLKAIYAQLKAHEEKKPKTQAQHQSQNKTSAQPDKKMPAKEHGGSEEQDEENEPIDDS